MTVKRQCSYHLSQVLSEGASGDLLETQQNLPALVGIIGIRIGIGVMNLANVLEGHSDATSFENSDWVQDLQTS